MGDSPQDEERLLGTVTHLRRSQVAFYVGLGLSTLNRKFGDVFWQVQAAEAKRGSCRASLSNNLERSFRVNFQLNGRAISS